MFWIIIAVVAAVLAALVGLLRSGNLRFWRAVQRYPHEAMAFFEAHPEVFAIEEVTHDTIDRSYYDAGPFLFMYVGCRLRIYARRAELRAAENEFLQQCHQTGGSAR